MPLEIVKAEASRKSRLAAYRLISMRLRLLEMWQQVTGGHNESLVMMAVIVITGDRLAGANADPKFRNMANALPKELLGRCNISSIAAATGLNRETARRVVNKLLAGGTLERSPDRSVNFAPGRMQGENALRLSQVQLDEFVRTANALIRDGVLSFRHSD